MKRIAWFSPFPPVRTGIAGRSAELVSILVSRGFAIDAYPESAAHDFPWRHRQRPYDLVVYQFGNSSHHDYQWPYALRYPGLVVLHDTRLHHARAALLLREKRAAEYRAEFAWNHPGVAADAAELAVAGFDSHLYYEWGMVRSLIASARLTAVHGEGARAELVASLSTPAAAWSERIVAIRLGEGEMLAPEREREARATVRARYGIPGDAVVFGCFGGLTPEKRIPQILAAFRATLAHAPSARLILAGAPAGHYDVAADVAARGLADRVTLTGYLDDDRALTDHLAACDVSLNLRWPTARETSGPWLRALAAGRATVVTELAHLADLPSLDPRTWAVSDGRWPMADQADQRHSGKTASSMEHRPSLIAHRSSTPLCVAIDILDEDHSLRLAMRRLAADAELRAQLGAAARAWWSREHTPDVMADDYARAIADAIARPAAPIALPAHMRDDGTRRMRELLDRFGVEAPF